MTKSLRVSDWRRIQDGRCVATDVASRHRSPLLRDHPVLSGAFCGVHRLVRPFRDAGLRIVRTQVGEAGAFEVVAASDRRLMLVREFEQPAVLSVHHLLAELYQGVDWVLVEGFKESDLLKIEVWRAPEPGKSERPVRYPEDGFVVAIATDAPDQLPEPTLRPVLDLNAPAQVVDWMLQNADRFEYDWEMHGETLR